MTLDTLSAAELLDPVPLLLMHGTTDANPPLGPRAARHREEADRSGQVGTVRSGKELQAVAGGIAHINTPPAMVGVELARLRHARVCPMLQAVVLDPRVQGFELGLTDEEGNVDGLDVKVRCRELHVRPVPEIDDVERTPRTGSRPVQEAGKKGGGDRFVPREKDEVVDGN